MRLAIIVSRGRIISGCALNVDSARMLIGDRNANREAFPNETAVRIPRRLTRTNHQRWAWGHIRSAPAIARLDARHFA